MMKALIEPRADFPTGFRVAQVEEDGNIFEVGLPLLWVDAPAEVTTEWDYDGNAFSPPPPPLPTPPKADRLAARVNRDPLIKAILAREASNTGKTIDDILLELEPHADV